MFGMLYLSFGEETILDDDYNRNYDEVGKISNETDRYIVGLFLINTRTGVMITVTA